MIEMAELERKKLVAARGLCKKSMARLEKYLASGSSFIIEELNIRKQNLIDIYNKYKEITLDLMVLAGDTAVEEDDTEDRYLQLMAELECQLKKLSPQGDLPKDTNFKVAKLPALDIPIFDAKDISGYKPFIEMFMAVIHTDTRISDIEKLCYLKKYVKGEALQIIDSLPIIGKSYNSALELLKRRYDNPALLVNSHVNSLLDLPTIQRSSAAQIRDLTAKIQQHVTSLVNLNQPVSQWDAILSCILLRKLDPLNVRLFHSDRDTTTVVTVDELLHYLEKRAASLEASPSSSEKSQQNKTKSCVNFTKVNDNVQCKMCPQSHKLYKCSVFAALTPQKRKEFVTKNNLCAICLAAHSQKCRYKFKCSVCDSSDHNALLHQIEEKSGSKANEKGGGQQVNLHVSQPISENVLLPTAKVIVSGANNKKYIVRALLDCGSQTSFCTTALAQKLGLPLMDSHKNFGTLGGSCNATVNKGINLAIKSMINDYKIDITCSVINKITSKLPQKQIDLSNFIIPKYVCLADNEFHIPGEISLLLASDIFFKIILNGKIEGGTADPILLNTQLGYIVSSTGIPNSNTAVAMHTVLNPDLDHCVRQFWETEKVPDIYHESIHENEYSEKVFRESVSLQNNTFEVKYPLKVELQDVDPSNSYAIALQRLYNLEKRFAKDPSYHDLYKKFIHEYIDLQHAKIIDTKNCDPKDEPLYFLSHQGVLRLDKQSVLRVVFDGSAKTKNGLSLNDLMCNGPVVQPPLFDILILFRTYRYTIQCDIRHMYRMIKVHPDHKRLQNILWRENGVMSILQLQTVTYGLTSSAFLATRCLTELANRYKKEYPLACEAVLKNSYVDDIQTGSNTIQEALQLKIELISLMQHANLNLHKWVSNNPRLLEDVPQDKLGFKSKDLDQDRSVVKILGLSYDSRDYVFRLSGQAVVPTKIPTKRNVLSSISRLFDPLGLAGPVTMKAKLFMQELWQRNLEWDTPLPIDLENSWNVFYTNLVNMPDIIIPRYVQTAGADEVELVGYCDASSSGYACTIYIKTKIDNKPHVNLLCSRSRLNGINSKLTIPKLELNGALLLAKLVSHVSSVLHIDKMHLFCDSKIVPGWLGIPPIKVPAYIGNRVKEITKLTPNAFWYFTPSSLNPADILSRGADPKDIVNNSMWRHGPDYLQNCDSYTFSSFDIVKPLQSNNLNENNVTCTVLDNEPIHYIFEKYSSLLKTIRVMAYALRFIKKCKKCDVNSGWISVGEFREALSTLIRGIQHYYLAEELKCISAKKDIKTSLKSLNPFLDDKNVLRVGGRLHNADANYSKKFPIILPKHCNITRLIIRQEHLLLMHGGIKLVLSSLAQRYYIINAVREVKSVIHKCIACCRHKAEVSKQLMGSLPKDRVTPARVFERVGLDYCGPFQIKQSTKRNSIISKGYVALFVCFASKAVHLEVVSDMSTDTFLAAFKRFISRRAIPSDVYCDNASTFKGRNNQLRDLYKLHSSKEFQEIIHSHALQKEIKFHFIPAYSPNHGGLWEAAVKSAKYHLKRISTCKIFTYEQFSTIMTEIESILNSRPLISNTLQDSSDFSSLTPGHLTLGCPLTAIPQPNLTEIPAGRLRFWRCCEQVRQHFWKVWSKDYLSTLNERTKWQKESPNIKVGTIVLLLNPNTPPLHWPLGKVTKTFCGKDNKVRVLELKTSDGKLHSRAVSKIVVLPVE